MKRETIVATIALGIGALIFASGHSGTNATPPKLENGNRTTAEREAYVAQQEASRHPDDHNAPKMLNARGANTVPIFRDGDALNRFFDLTRAGIKDPSLIYPLLSCIVADKTKFISVDGGFFSSTILIVEGEHKGCTGVVTNESGPWVNHK
jgi:hypothetical protein